MKKLRLLFGGLLFITLAAAIIFLTNEVVAAAPAYLPLLDDPTPTPCVLSGELEDYALDPFAPDSWSGDNTYSDVIVDSSGATSQFTITIKYHGYSARDWFGEPEDYASNIYFEAFSDSQGIGSTFPAVGPGEYSGKTTIITHEYTQPDGALSIIFYGNAPAVAAHSWLTIDSIMFDGLAISAPCDCAYLDPDDMDATITATLSGSDEVGHTIDLTEDETYLLYTSPGPWNDGADDRTDAAIRFYDGEDWGEFTALADYDNEAADTQPPCDDSFLEEGYDALTFVAQSNMTQVQIRVNDTAENFEDNTGYLNYFLYANTGGFGQSCAANWSKDDLVGTIDLDSTSASYQYLEPGHISEGLYALEVTGTYLDNGVDSDDVRIADFPVIASGNHDNWLDSNTWTGTEFCTVEEPGEKTYYGSARDDFYDPDLTYNFRYAQPLTIVNDDDSNYANNSGTVQVAIYTAGYTAPPDDCAGKYEISTFIEGPVIFANNADGAEYPQHTNGLVIGQDYYLENVGTPYLLNGSESYDFEIGYSMLGGASSVQWEDPEVFFSCITPLDESRNGYYFTAEHESIWLRAEFGLGGHDDNTGSIKFKLHGAVPFEVPEEESCGDYLDLDSLKYRGSIAADDTPGFSIDYSVFEPGQEYLIKVVTPPYTDPDGTGKTGELRRIAPGMGSVSYGSFEDFDGGICYEQVDGYDHVYFKAADVSDYEVRATEPTGGNSGTFTFEVWGLDRIQEPILGCELSDYGDVEAWYVVKQNEQISASNNGDINSNPYVLADAFLTDDLNFKLETGYLNGLVAAPLWDLQISNNGGASWIFLSDWVDCWVDLGTPEARGYFTTPVDGGGGPFLLRVYDVAEIYYGNAGGVEISLWVDSASEDPGIPYNPVGYWANGCTAACITPGWLEVGQWIEFARCRLTGWLAWCPWHSELLGKLQENFYKIEPFGTIMELVGLGRAVQVEINSYSWVDDGGGVDPEDPHFITPENFIFMPGEGGGAEAPIVGEDSIWGSGEIVLSPPDGTSYSTECDNTLADSVGTRLAAPMCFAFNVVDQLGLKSWFQLIWDIGMVVGLLFYVKNNWVDKNS